MGAGVLERAMQLEKKESNKKLFNGKKRTHGELNTSTLAFALQRALLIFPLASQ